ncbi:oxysterol-binding protein related protein OSH2 RNJ42_04986 [Nakaseomyces bracarensis]|uniref:oxysterol-binding protein related protein OSH2 n=1 Tax=Nakaseomyces bracarensis TaxID=273131 RepID=UPI003871BF8A
MSSLRSRVSKPLLKLKLLEVMTNGTFEELNKVLDAEFQPVDDGDVKEVSSHLLHYAVQVAPLELIRKVISEYVVSNPSGEMGIQSGANGSFTVKLDINSRDSNGNTPLHLAVSQSRADVVTLLMDQPTINDTIVNNAGQEPIEMCKTLDIAHVIQVKRDEYVGKVAESLRDAFNKRNYQQLEAILSVERNKELIDLNGIDPISGDTVLHEFVRQKDLNMCKWLIDHGADPLRRNQKGLLPMDLIKTPSVGGTGRTAGPERNAKNDAELKKFIDSVTKDRRQEVSEDSGEQQEAPTYKGYLKKWTNLAKGFKLRWFVLSEDGYLKYYKDQPKEGSQPRGQVHLSMCRFVVDKQEKYKFELIVGDHDRWKLKGNNSVEYNKWSWVIQDAIKYAKEKRAISKNPGVNNEFTTSQVSLAPSAVTTRSRANSMNNQKFVHAARVHKPSILSNGESSDADSVPDTQHSKIARNSPIAPIPNNLRSPSSRVVTSVSPVANSLYGDRKTSASVPYNNISDDDVDGILVNPIDPDEEYLKTQYGPFIDNLNVYKKTISMQLSSVLELLDNVQGEAEVETIKETIKNTVKTFNNLITLGAERDRKLVDMVTKTNDINNVWINSVKDLEIELNKKEEQLDALAKERRYLRKSMNMEFLEAGDNQIARRASTIVSKFLTNTKAAVDDGRGDEFYDAEELIDEIGSVRDVVPSETASAQAMRENINNLPETTKTEPSFRTTQPHVELPKVPEINSSAPKSPSSAAPMTPESAAPMTPGSATEKSADTTAAADESIASKKPASQDRDLKEVETTQSSAGTKVEKDHGDECDLQMKIYKKSSLKPVSSSQKEKEDVLLKEGSFLGYDEGVRKRLKLDDDDRPKISLWGVLKSMVGKDMTKMTLPVQFNEPTSLLQRVAEDMEYSDLLDKAAAFDDSTLRLLYVSVFTASAYASTTKRVAKPFNPLLGETFEYSRPDKQYRFFAEQVSHHPPISATYTESPRWDFYGESYVDTHFNGRQFNVKHLGLWYINLRPNGSEKSELYTFKKPNNNVIGILVGNPQVDNYGEVIITNHATGDYCKLFFKARGWRSSSAYEVKGEVFDSKNKKQWVLGGHWHDSIYAKKAKGKDAEFSIEKESKSSHKETEPNYDGKKFLLWKVSPRPDAPFHLTPFAITLNAPMKHLLPWLPPTDTRLRPDQRAMEDGEYDKAAEEKHRVEEKQRAARRVLEEKNETYKPSWFTKETHPVTKKPFWKFHGDYWEQRRDHNLKDKGDIF